MAVEFNFKSQVATTIQQSERMIALGIKKETADCYWFFCDIAKEWKCTILSSTQVFKDYPTTVFPAWSLHRLIEILDTNPFVFYTNCGYDTVIDHVEEYIRSGFIDTRYLEEWCLNEEE